MSFFGLKKRQILMYDSKGLLTTERSESVESYKMGFVRDTRIKSLESAVRASDVVIGVARGDLIKPGMLKRMRESAGDYGDVESGAGDYARPRRWRCAPI